MPRQGGLGRGLASLIPQRKKTNQKKDNSREVNYFGGRVSEDIPYEGLKDKLEPRRKKGIGDISLRSILEVSIDSILPNPYQPRKEFNEEKLEELSESIKSQGIIQPLVVSRKGNDQYELVAGERRLEAAKIAGLEKVPVVVRKVSDQDKVEMALIENIQRHDLNVIEEARSFKHLMEKFGMTQDEVAKKIGKSRSVIANTVRLLNLPIEIQRALSQGKVSEGHARTILAISNPEKQRALFELILKDNLSVRQVEERIREISVSSHRRRIRPLDPELIQKQEALSEFLGTKVKIKKSSKGGQIIIDFFSLEELGSLINKLRSNL